jgi:hypothetical protein
VGIKSGSVRTNCALRTSDGILNNVETITQKGNEKGSEVRSEKYPELERGAVKVREVNKGEVLMNWVHIIEHALYLTFWGCFIFAGLGVTWNAIKEEHDRK